jgi:hypothetical protein
MTDEDWEARLAVEVDEPPDPELDPDPEDCAPPPGQDELTAAEIAQCRELAAADARATAHAARLGLTGHWPSPAPPSAAAARASPDPRIASPGSTPARPPGSPPACRWMPRRAAPRWRRSPRMPPGTMTATRGSPMTS